MTNIPADITMEKLQKTAHPATFSFVLRERRGDKLFWQRIWLIDRFVEAVGFTEVDK